MKLISGIIILVLSIVLIIIAIFVYLKNKDNFQRKQSTILYPFSAQLSPPNPPWTVTPSPNNIGVGNNPEDGLYLSGLVNGTNTPQMTCPPGFQINIVGAFVDIIDPYSECSPNSDDMFKLTCGDRTQISKAGVCSSDSDCGAGMTCFSEKCVPMTCSTHSDCASSSTSGTIAACPSTLMNPNTKCSTQYDCGSGMACVGGMCVVDPGAGACMACVDANGNPIVGSGKGTCANMPTCANTTNGVNSVCSAANGDKYQCRPRDATAYLAEYCNGKSTCLGDPTDVWNPNDPTSPFGPLPCHIPASSSSSEYASLPITTGWAGGTPVGGSVGSSPASFSQGYYVHGIYTCVAQ